MTTRRHPVRPSYKLRITPEAIAAFRRMESARFRCTCPRIDWDGKYWERPEPCAACNRWWVAHKVLHDELGLPPWQWPAFEYPDALCPYPDGCEAAKQWQRKHDERLEALALYAALVQAAKSTDPANDPFRA